MTNTFVTEPSLQKFGCTNVLKDNFRLLTLVSELVRQNFLLVVLDASFLFRSCDFITVGPEAVQFLANVFGTFVSEFRNFGIITSVSELMIYDFGFGTSISQLSCHSS